MPFICVCVGKIVNLAMKITKDMKSAFLKGSCVQMLLLPVQLTDEPRKTGTKVTLAFCVFAFQAVKP